MEKIFVVNEFAQLKTVIVSQSEFGVPSIESDDNFLTIENAEQISKASGKDIRDTFPEIQQKWEVEKENFIHILEQYNIKVYRPRLLTDFEKEDGLKTGYGYSNFFCRDPFFTVGSFIIEGNLRFFHRRNEIFPIRDIIYQAVGCYYFSCPKEDTSLGYASEVGPFLEGGDILVYNNTILVGNSGLASNDRGIWWLKNMMKNFGYEVIHVPLHKDILHLDCAISLVREGLMIICEEALVGGIPHLFKHWDKIFISMKEASCLAANGLPINEQVYVTDPQFGSVIEELLSRNITVELVDYSVSRSFGGSFRCTTQALWRE